MSKFFIKFLIYAFIMNLSLGYDGPNIDYCKFECWYASNDDKKTHTICKLQHNCEPSPNCKYFHNMPLSNKEKQEIVDIHNEWRNRIALGEETCLSMDEKKFPTAADMREIVWDSELEFQAQCWANQCVVGHDSCRITSYGWPSGQNLLWTADKGIPILLRKFYNECNNTLIEQIKKFAHHPNRKPQVGHFTQFIWGNVSRIGCARTFYYSNNGHADDSSNRTHLACNYAYGGNYLDGQVYELGAPCSKCPDGSQCHSIYKGLCATEPSTSKVPNICNFAVDKEKCVPYLGLVMDDAIPPHAEEQEVIDATGTDTTTSASNLSSKIPKKTSTETDQQTAVVDTSTGTKSQLEQETEAETEVKTEPEGKTETESKQDVRTEAGQEVGTEAETEVGTEAGTEAVQEVGTKSGTETGQEVGTETGIEAGTEAGQEIETETRIESTTQKNRYEIESFPPENPTDDKENPENLKEFNDNQVTDLQGSNSRLCNNEEDSSEPCKTLIHEETVFVKVGGDSEGFSASSRTALFEMLYIIRLLGIFL